MNSWGIVISRAAGESIDVRNALGSVLSTAATALNITLNTEHRSANC